MTTETPESGFDRGGSAAAIRYHYDVSNEFYRSWLDRSMTYSCAMWDGLDRAASLDEAQARKRAFHADALGAGPGMSILDIGCGWGSMMRDLTEVNEVGSCIGLTLSEQQARYIQENTPKRTKVVLQNWYDYDPDVNFDGIVSIGAFEHFAQPSQTENERREVYREFFRKCRTWLKPGGILSLQTIAYGSMAVDDANQFISKEIFPDAELPTVSDIATASEGVLRMTRLRDDGIDYARTCEAWAHRLSSALKSGEVEAGPLSDRYKRYLRLSAAGFRLGRIVLLRMKFEPLTRR